MKQLSRLHKIMIETGIKNKDIFTAEEKELLEDLEFLKKHNIGKKMEELTQMSASTEGSNRGIDGVEWGSKLDQGMEFRGLVSQVENLNNANVFEDG